MAWSDRQHAVLRQMGLRVWAPPAAAVTAPQFEAPGRRPAPILQPGPAPEPEAVAMSAPPVDAGRADRIAGMDWQALRAEVTACQACALCHGRIQPVFGVGATQARWLVVGEGPGTEEDVSGEPFVGPSGQLLDRMLAALGLTRTEDGDPAQQVYIANAVKCRPPHNRNPTPDELDHCEPYLQRQITLLQPTLILALGAIAVRSLLHSSDAIGKLRGKVHRCQGLPVIVTYHPAYLLRNLPAKARAWEDLCLAAATAAAR
jgi:DNA polymerase